MSTLVLGYGWSGLLPDWFHLKEAVEQQKGQPQVVTECYGDLLLHHDPLLLDQEVVAI